MEKSKLNLHADLFKNYHLQIKYIDVFSCMHITKKFNTYGLSNGFKTSLLLLRTYGGAHYMKQLYTFIR